jgi:DNA polymerase-3 subunit gamma/tau
LNIVNQADIHYKASKNQRLHVEIALLKLVNLKAAISLISAVPSAEESEVKKKVS